MPMISVPMIGRLTDLVNVTFCVYLDSLRSLPRFGSIL